MRRAFWPAYWPATEAVMPASLKKRPVREVTGFLAMVLGGSLKQMVCLTMHSGGHFRPLWFPQTAHLPVPATGSGRIPAGQRLWGCLSEIGRASRRERVEIAGAAG